MTESTISADLERSGPMAKDTQYFIQEEFIMAENIYVDFSEEIEQDLLTRYESLCNEVTEHLNSMSGEAAELCQKTQYEPMVNVVNQTIALFDEEIVRVAASSFEAWRDGEGSFTAAARTSQAGDSAMETAQHLETSVNDLFSNFWSSHPMGDAIQVDTSRPTVRSEDFDTLKELYNKYFGNIGSTGEEAVSSIREAGSDNPTYNIIIPAVMAIAEPIKYAFEQFSVKIDEAKEQSDALTQQQSAHNEEAAETATQTNATAAEIADAVKMYSDI